MSLLSSVRGGVTERWSMNVGGSRMVGKLLAGYVAGVRIMCAGGGKATRY